ncbi:chemotaxis protein CheA [Candidatus Nitrotoga sp. 1052]|uniref:chemotaxis protein CheA n=1 Tax=Candidatus Nitrotoga sp. 1052 TaxID=2886964 RepID=UPI001EF73DC1|nr:chemotaxis protein CheA [Candidatus Nitrotoga sp. 1052]CAH1073858.1 Signal transduction histidine kinase CheA [Candidatus Nitrotoga sp. 1052]
MSLDLDQALQTYIAEARELLQDMEDSLLRLEVDPNDADTIGAIFRAAHTIKGSAGLFGLDPIVSFTHIVEDVLDRVRDGDVVIEANLIAVLLESGDHMLHLVDVVAAQGGQLDAEAIARESGLRVRLQAYQDDSEMSHAVQVETEIPLQSSGGGLVETDNWHISLRFGQNVMRDGMDPLSFLRYLSTLGEIVSITTMFDALPPADEMDAESCYLGFEIDFKSDADKATIAGVFEFAREGSLIHILPPHSKLTEYIELIRSLPESETRLGEILVTTGALTQQELEAGLSEQQTSARPDGSTTPLGEILVEQRSVEHEVVQAALDKQTQSKDSKNKENRYIRVHADKLDELINMVGELVIAGAGVSLLAQRVSDNGLQEATSVMSGLVEEIRDGALRLRMVPIGETFNRFQRVVRDVGRELGKDIELVITGADTELDKTVVEKIGDPLMHLVRNAMDHGIESASIRQSRGKSAKGTLRLNAYHDSGSIVIEIVDDGGGLNRDRILQKARERGLIAPNVTPPDHEIFNMIFEAGFSTAEAVTSISGRGVGMDVVKRNITALRGTVNLDSAVGQGTTVSIRLPLTLAIIDGFLVGVGKSSYIVPLDMVQECIELTENDRQLTRERSYLNLRGEVLPFVMLRDHFEVEGAGARRENVVVVTCAGQKAGLVVDELMGEFQTVIKPLGKIFSTLRGISGSTILGSGEVALILDVPSLVQQAVNRETHQVSTRQLTH